MLQLLVQHKHSWKGTNSAEGKQRYLLLFVRCPSSLFTLKHPVPLVCEVTYKYQRRRAFSPIHFRKPIIFRNYIKLLAIGKLGLSDVPKEVQEMPGEGSQVEPAAWLLAHGTTRSSPHQAVLSLYSPFSPSLCPANPGWESSEAKT